MKKNALKPIFWGFLLLIIGFWGCSEEHGIDLEGERCESGERELGFGESCPMSSVCANRGGYLCVLDDGMHAPSVKEKGKGSKQGKDSKKTKEDIKEGTYYSANCPKGYVTHDTNKGKCPKGETCISGQRYGVCFKLPDDVALKYDPTAQSDVQKCTEAQLNPPKDSLRMHIIDVGQGDAIWIQSPDGKNVLIDAGDSGMYGKSNGGKIVEHYLQLWNLPDQTRFDAVVVSHAHSDHFGGMPYLFRKDANRYSMRNYVDPGNMNSSASYLSWIKNVREYGKEVQVYMPASEFWKAGDLMPSELFGKQVKAYYLYSSIGGSNLNNNSVVIKLEFAGRSILFTGDLEIGGENQLLKNVDGLSKELLTTNILKVGHHGSNTASSETFLQAIYSKIPKSERYALISSGRKPYSGVLLPTEVVLKRFFSLLDKFHLFSTAAGDIGKDERYASKDDNILIVIDKESKIEICYVGVN